MLAAEHFEHGVDTFPPGQILYDLFIFVALVVDSVLQAEFLHPFQLFIGGRGAIHLHSQQLSDLHRRCSNPSGDRVNQNPGSTLPSVLPLD